MPKQNDTQRALALKSALEQVEKQFGKGAVMRLGDGAAGQADRKSVV